MDPLKNMIESIRNFFVFFNRPVEKSRKRRGSYLDTVSPKVSRYSPYNAKVRIIPIQRESDDDIQSWISRRPETYKKFLLQNQHRTPMKPLRLEDTDGVNEINKNSFKLESRGKFKGFTSTPANIRGFPSKSGCENEDDDVILVKTTKSPREKKEDAKLAGFSYIKPKSSPTEKPLFSLGAGNLQNGNKSKGCLRPALNGARGQCSLDYSFRLDDKLKYRKLLEQATSYSSPNSSIYKTPPSKIFNPYDSIGSITNTKSPLFSLNKSQEKPTVRETIMKVIESEPVVIADSDSEGSVVIVNPPSPKPDIKVDPINSLKKIVDTSKVSRKDWLDELIERHQQNAQERQREIVNLRQCSKKSEEINHDIKIELLRRQINDCLLLKEAILPVIEVDSETELPELTEEHERMVQRAFRGNLNEILARKFNLNITRRDLMTLSGLNWLNDEVINFYMNLIIERGKDSRWPKSYAFNTFFYTKLLKDGPQSLRRWTKRVDIFEHDLVCIPIHLGMHWCMAIIDFRDKSIRYYDSMGSPNSRCLEALKNYLVVEHKDKKGSHYDTRDFVLENMENIPQQMNGSDCGMFACTFAEFITRNAKITFKQEDMPYFRKKMVVEIITGEFLIK